MNRFNHQRAFETNTVGNSHAASAWRVYKRVALKGTSRCFHSQRFCYRLISPSAVFR